VIGQSLEAAKLASFELDKNGPDYLLRSKALTRTNEWIVRHALNQEEFQGSGNRAGGEPVLSFSARDLARLDEEAQRRRRQESGAPGQESSRLSQLLRTVGDHLDRMNVTSFHIASSADAITVNYQDAGGQHDSRTFTREKLQQLGFHTRFRRGSRASRW
jgi:hypothetical protein